jgi:hypothetical protein
MADYTVTARLFSKSDRRWVARPDGIRRKVPDVALVSSDPDRIEVAAEVKLLRALGGGSSIS